MDHPNHAQHANFDASCSAVARGKPREKLEMARKFRGSPPAQIRKLAADGRIVLFGIGRLLFQPLAEL
jgi:hypothetical protein